MASLRRDYPEFKALNTEIIVFGPEKESEFRDYWEKQRMPFPGIADPQHTAANLYGQQVKPLKMGRMPALFVVDKQGIIHFKHFGQSMSDIPTDSDVLGIFKQLENTAGS